VMETSVFLTFSLSLICGVNARAHAQAMLMAMELSV